MAKKTAKKTAKKLHEVARVARTFVVGDSPAELHEAARVARRAGAAPEVVRGLLDAACVAEKAAA